MSHSPTSATVKQSPQTLTQSLLKLASSWDFPTGGCSCSLAGVRARARLGGGARRAADADPDAAGAHGLGHGALGDHDLAVRVPGGPAALPGLLAGAGAGQRVAPGEGETGLRQPATGEVSSLGVSRRVPDMHAVFDDV